MRLAALLAAVLLATCATAAVAQDRTPVQEGSTPPWAPGTRAQPNPADQAVRQACAADARTLCSGVQPGGGRILQCFKKHAADISPGCKAAMAQMRAAAGGGRFSRRDGSVPTPGAPN